MTLAWHVARQMWIQLRLLALVMMPPAAAVVAVFVDGQVGSDAGRLTLGIGFALAAVLSAALVGNSFADEIGSGSAAWLVVRAVPRASLIGAWLALPSVAILAAYVVAGILAGLAITTPLGFAPDPVAVTVGIVAAAAPAFALSAVALLIGVDTPGRLTFLAVLGVGAVLALPLILLGQTAIHPATGYWLVAGMVPADRPITVGLRAIGLCLVLAAGAWAVAARRFASRDL